MIRKKLFVVLLLGLFVVIAPMANSQYIDTTGNGQIYVNQPFNTAQPGNFLPSSGYVPYANLAPVAEPAAGPVAAPYAYPITAPLAAAPIAPFTSGFTYSAQQASAFGPFTPPVSQSAEQFYQFPGITPYGPYPGAGYAAAGGIGFDPVSGYYGPYGAYTPIY